MPRPDDLFIPLDEARRNFDNSHSRRNAGVLLRIAITSRIDEELADDDFLNTVNLVADWLEQQ